MVRHVAVDEKIAHALLAPAAAALRLGIIGLPRSDGLRVHARGRGGEEGRPLVQATVKPGVFCLGLLEPADGTAVDVMDVEHLRSTMDDAPLDRVAQVGPGHRRCRVSEGVGAVGVGQVHLAKPVLLKLQAVEERLATVV